MTGRGTDSAPTDPEPTDEPLVEVDVSGATLRASDVAGNRIAIDLVGWDELDEAPEFPGRRTPDATITGRASELRYVSTNFTGIEPGPDADVEADVDDDAFVGSFRYDLTINTNAEVSFEGGSSLIESGGERAPVLHVAFDGAATLTRTDLGDGRYRDALTFPHPKPVTIGFRSTVDRPRETVTVEPTVDGVATAVDHLPAALDVLTVERADDGRSHPPRIAFGDETDVPESVRESVPDTGIELEVPGRLDALYPAAPLVTYLGADVTVTADATPALRAPEIGLEHEFAPAPNFQYEAGRLLRRAFVLEYVARWTVADDVPLHHSSLLESAEIDPDAFVEDSPARRLETCLADSSVAIDDELPDWRYRTYLTDDVENVRAVPFLVDDLCQIRVADGATGDAANGDLHSRTEPGAGDEAPGTIAAKSPSAAKSDADPLHRAARVVGTVGDAGPAYGTFRATPDAYENRLGYVSQERATISGHVLGPADAVEAVIRRYDHLDDTTGPSSSVRRTTDPSDAELRSAFGDGDDLVHVVGNYDADAGVLRCGDGRLPGTAIDSSDVQIALLDAPGAAPVARRLVDRGSVCAVARRPGTDASPDRMARLGELLLYGHSVAQARGVALAGGDPGEPIVVGDGGHRFVATDNPCIVDELGTDDDGDVRITTRTFGLDPRRIYSSELLEAVHLALSPATATLEMSELRRYLGTLDVPVYFDGELYFPDENGRLVYPIA